MTAVGPGTRVTLHFSLRLESGHEVDRTREPATFVVGDGNLPDGFERAMFGLEAGADAALRIAPEHGFGLPSRERMLTLPMERFRRIPLQRGIVVSFDTPDGPLAGVVAVIEEESVTVDFNHPLAGHTLLFDVEILDVQRIA